MSNLKLEKNFKLQLQNPDTHSHKSNAAVIRQQKRLVTGLLFPTPLTIHFFRNEWKVVNY